MYEISEKSEKEQNCKPVLNTPPNGKRSLRESKASHVPHSVNFASAMLESSGLKRPKKSINLLISLVSQSAFVILLILLPLLYTQAFTVPEFEKTMLVIPPPPPPPPPRNEVRAVPKPKVSFFDQGKLIAPRVVPKHVAILREAPAESSGASGVAGGVPGGVPGGTMGGVLGGILSSANSTVPPPPKPKSNKPLRVGGQVQAPRLIRKVEPQYPPLAKQTRTQGSVVIDCVVDKQGNVTQVKLVSGHPLLVEAALQAVRQWKYQPTLLNGEPVAVEMTVTVTFTLGE